ncbi:MAG: DUF1254 domain-containing protein [Pseudomonadota bacterium]
MMSRLRPWQIAIGLFVISALVAHVWMLARIPTMVMSTARALFIENGAIENGWSPSPRVTPETQRIVRPSPDLAYSICLFDASSGPVEISAPAWDGYGSLSIFNERTDNVFVTSLDAAEDAPNQVIVGPEGYVPSPDIAIEGEAPPILILTGEGVALIRRLAPSQALHDAAQSLVDQSVCQPLSAG